MTIQASTQLTIAGANMSISAHDTLAGPCVSVANLTNQVDGPPAVRLQSACLFGEAFGSIECDCAPQLTAALHFIAQTGPGVLIYLPQEGRGVGLVGKIRALELQRLHGINTYEAFRRLGFAPDLREYDAAFEALADVGISSASPIRLISNNPAKLQAFAEHGYVVASVEKMSYRVDERAERYLVSKATIAGHAIDFSSLEFARAEGRNTRAIIPESGQAAG